MPSELRADLEKEAAVSSRSLNAEVVSRLQASIDGSGGLQLPDGMLKKLQIAAKKAKRSVESELLHRMIDSLAEMPPPEARLREALEAERKENARLRMENDDLLHNSWKRQTMLYVLLDTNGYPISWAEIHEHLRGIKEAGGFNPDQMHTNIITPDMESSSRRASEAATLAKLWREGGRSTMSESPAIADVEGQSNVGKVARRSRKPKP